MYVIGHKWAIELAKWFFFLIIIIIIKRSSYCTFNIVEKKEVLDIENKNKKERLLQYGLLNHEKYNIQLCYTTHP